MNFQEEGQQPGSPFDQDQSQERAQEQGAEAEPRLLTRPDREPARKDRRDGVREPARVRAQSPLPRPKRVGIPRPERVRRARLFRIWGRVVVGFAVLVAAVALGVIVYMRHAVNTSLPQVDGTVRVQGLRGPVTVTRDGHGVPTISGSSLPDVLFAQGYVTASDRLWQMDSLRRHAAGELAEVLGPALVEHDRRQRYLQIRATADRALGHLPPDQMAQLEAYAQGVNAYIESHGNALPIEFRLLAYKPAPWTPRDTLLVSLAMWQDLSTEFPRKLSREALAAHLPAELLPDLYPTGSWRDQPPGSQSRDLTAPHEVEQIPLDPSQSRAVPVARPAASAKELLAVSEGLRTSAECADCRAGSNDWVVSGARTASGAPMVSNDMHLALNLPDIWYEASLHADLAPEEGGGARLDVSGFTLPGAPFVIVGRNPRVAWGVTNLGADVQDLRVEHLRGEGAATQFEQADGTWAAAGHRAETIHVRGGRDVVLDVVTTTHANGAGTMETPVISPLYPKESRALSLAWTAYDPEAVNSPFLGVNTATDGAGLVRAFAKFGGPTLNLVWGDAEGHIGYHAIGMIPVRGAAVQHPRAVQAPVIMEPGAAPPDEGTDEGGGPEAFVSPGPHLVLSAFHPVRRGADGRGVRARRAPAARAVRPARAARVQPVQEPPVPATPVINYTIGSPVSVLPVDALDAAQAWTEYVPYDALPAVLDPKNGLLATANARISADDYPYALTADWEDPFRVERIVHMLSGRRGLTSEEMLRMQTDVYSDVNRVLAQRLAYAVDHASAGVLAGDAGTLRDAANFLRNWDGQMRVGSPAAAIVTTVRDALWPALLIPQIAAHDGIDPVQARDVALLYSWGERTTALELLIQHEPARWLPKPYTNWNDFLAAAMATALRTAHAPGSLARWHYGQVHTVEIAHPIFAEHRWLARLIGIRATSGAQAAPGDGTTVNAIRARFGPSERFTADLSAADAGLANITTGESANPHSPWYLDQFRPWLEGRSFELPRAGGEAAHTLVLQP